MAGAESRNQADTVGGATVDSVNRPRQAQRRHCAPTLMSLDPEAPEALRKSSRGANPGKDRDEDKD